jgi:hypothetical protein
MLMQAATADGNGGRAAPHWQAVRVQTACEAMSDEFCLGRYGFAVRNDGAWLAGPSPAGRRLEGHITPEELRRLDRLAMRFSTAGALQVRQEAPRTLPGVKDQIDIEFGPGEVVRVYDLGGPDRKVRYRGTWEQATRLHAETRKLLARYYPTPFPSGENAGTQ